MTMTRYDYAERSARRLLALGATPEELRTFLDALARNKYITWADNLQLRMELLYGELGDWINARRQ